MRASTLIVGSGFAARSVASKLQEDVLLLERGEARAHAEMVRRRALFARDHSSLPWWEIDRAAYRSAQSFAAVYRLSPRCFSQFEFIGGGSSNRWGGNAERFTPITFSRRDAPLAWPLSYSDMVPWYEEAEERLNVCFDPVDPRYKPGMGRIEGGDAFRQGHESLRLVFGPQAKNLKSHAAVPGAARQGLCCGADNCEMCPSDAKARPATRFTPARTVYGHYATAIRFEADRAVAVECFTEMGPRVVECERLVIAANAVESAALLARSRLPEGVPRARIGATFQDHALCEVVIKLPARWPHLMMNTLASARLPELDAVINGIEVIAVVRTEPPDEAAFRRALERNPAARLGKAVLLQDLSRLAMLSVLLEMPPHRTGISVRFEGAHPTLADDSYSKFARDLDRVMEVLLSRVASLGLKIVETRPHYRHTYGVHHLMSTLPMGSVVDTHGQVLGTSNVFVAGGATYPVAGAHGPTLTAVALSLRLGERLARREAGRT